MPFGLLHQRQLLRPKLRCPLCSREGWQLPYWLLYKRGVLPSRAIGKICDPKSGELSKRVFNKWGLLFEYEMMQVYFLRDIGCRMRKHNGVLFNRTSGNPMPHAHQLQRTVKACDVPPLDRAVAGVMCKLIIAQDRVPLDPAFFSRAVGACNGSLVWPKSVLRHMEGTQPPLEKAELDREPKPKRNAALGNIKLNTGLDESPWVKASALVSPDRLLGIRSACFNSFSMDALMRLSMAKATLEWLSEAPDPCDSIPLLRNTQFMAHAFGLDESSTELLKFMCLATQTEGLRLVLSSVECFSMATGLDILTRWIGNGNRAAIESLFSCSGILVQLGMHRGFDINPTDLEDVMRLRNTLILEQLQREHKDERSFLESFLNVSAPPQLTTDDIPHLATAHKLHRSLLTNATHQFTRGVNVLLYGDPGTGKTEYARLLAHSSGITLYEIESSTPQGSSAEPGQRLGMLLVTLRALQYHSHAAVLFDEAEDFFEPPSRSESRSFKNLSKAWINHFLENTNVPVIWTSNQIHHIEPSLLRRFMVLQELRSPPVKVRAKIAEKHLAPLGLDSEDIRSIASLPGLTPAQIEITAKTIQLAAPKDAPEARIWIQQHLTTSRRALGFGSGGNIYSRAVPFNPLYLNTRNGPSIDKLLQHLGTNPAVSLCLYGLPGTGKTEFARFVAEQLGRELVVKTASDLLSKWVGDTEQKIAGMFESCAERPQETLLLLDEADTFLRTRQGARTTWEVSHTNEFLARMSEFPGTFICTTNLFEELDTAVLRRFQFRIQFDAMKDDQVLSMFETTFGFKTSTDCSHLKGLVPADFSNVKRQLQYMDACTEKDVRELLRVEALTRQGNSRKHPAIGFY